MSQTKKVSKEANIRLRVRRDDDDNIETIEWQATDAPTSGKQRANAMMLALWDPEERNSLRIDLWTKEMTVEDMNDFFFQTLLTMADTYRNATNNLEIMADIKTFAREFAEKAAQMDGRGA